MTDETRLSQELTRRAHDLHTDPLTLDDIRSRATRIRRRRAAGLTVAAAVAVLAVVVPVSLLSGGPTGSTPDPAPPAVPTGHGAAVLHDGVVTMPDGTTVEVDVDNEDVSEFGVLTDGRVVIARSDLRAVEVLSPEGEPVGQYPVEITALALGPTDETAAWVDREGTVQVLESGSVEPVDVGSAPSTEFASYWVEAVIGADCAAGGCQVLVGDGNTTQEVAPTGLQDLGTIEPLRVSDVNPAGSLWAVTFPSAENEQYGCSGLYDPEADEVVARNCETSGLTFSPDGQHLIGMRGDNNMFGEVDVFDLDLERVGRYSPDPQVVSRSAFADDTHVLVAVTDWRTNEWTLVRVGLAGTDPEVLEGPENGRPPESIAEFLLSD